MTASNVLSDWSPYGQFVSRGDIVTINTGLMAYKAGSFDLLRFASRRLPRACLNRGSKSN
jgi:hypothetical protein